jgi:type II secretory pathway component GspD/PulD (secretin)
LIALHPEQDAYVTAENTEQGAAVTIPAQEGSTCSAAPGASAGTVVCELAPAPTRVAQQPPPGNGGVQPTPPAAAGEPVVNLEFQEAPLVEVLTALAKYADRNIIATTAVAGTVSVHLTNVTLTQALDLILKLNGLDYTLIGDRNYVVGTAEEIQRLKVVGAPTKVIEELIYKPQQTTPERLARELKDFAEKAGVTIKIVEDTKSVVFMDVPDQETAERLRKLASEFDVPPVDTTRWIQLEHITPAEAAATLQGSISNVEIRMPGPEAPQVGVIGLSGKTVDVDQAEALLVVVDVEKPKPPDQPPGEMVAVVVRAVVPATLPSCAPSTRALMVSFCGLSV